MGLESLVIVDARFIGVRVRERRYSGCVLSNVGIVGETGGVDAGRRMTMEQFPVDVVLQDDPRGTGAIRAALGGHVSPHQSIAREKLFGIRRPSFFALGRRRNADT